MGKAIEGLIFDVQRFSVHDGLGIRTTVFLKGCPLRCPWCQNPESLRSHAEIAFYADRCRNTGDCFDACPLHAVQKKGDRIAREQCDGCGLCVPACPFGALQRVGRAVFVDEIVEEIVRDRPFYESSGGGITLSGGEPTMQMEFLGALTHRCREKGLSVGLQTCGAFRWESFKPYLGDFDFIQFDIKVMDAEAHKALIGADNRTILSNARSLLGAGARVEFRMPIIPGHTDSDVNLREVASFLRVGHVSMIRLLRYHAMGEAKLPRLGFPIPPLNIAKNGRGDVALSRAAEILRTEGLEVLA